MKHCNRKALRMFQLAVIFKRAREEISNAAGNLPRKLIFTNPQDECALRFIRSKCVNVLKRSAALYSSSSLTHSPRMCVGSCIEKSVDEVY